MGATRGFNWMDPDDPLANVDLEIKSLAESILTAPIDPGVVIAAGWTLTGAWLRKFGSELVWVEVQVTRTGATITAPANGNVGGTDVFTFPAGYKPLREQPLLGMRGAAGVWHVRVNPAASGGVAAVEGGYPTATIAAGDTMTITGWMSLT